MNNEEHAPERETLDNSLEDARYGDTFHPGKDQEQLPGDGDTPATPATDTEAEPLDEPAGDTDVDTDEAYQEGISQAADNNDRSVGPDTRPEHL